MRRLVVRGVMGGRCRFGELVVIVAGFLWRSQEGGLAVVCVGGGIDINRLVWAAACCVCGLVSGGGRGGL